MIEAKASRTHRRANRTFERGVAVLIDPNDLTDEESQALLSDPEISIREVPDEAKEPAKAAKPKDTGAAKTDAKAEDAKSEDGKAEGGKAGDVEPKTDAKAEDAKASKAAPKPPAKS